MQFSIIQSLCKRNPPTSPSQHCLASPISLPNEAIVLFFCPFLLPGSFLARILHHHRRRRRRKELGGEKFAVRQTIAMAGSWKLQVDANEDLRVSLAAHVADVAAAAVTARGAFSVVLSGGSLIEMLSKLCESPYLEKVDWAKWHVFWADERVVKKDHPDSNYKLAWDGLLSKVPIPDEQVYSINDTLSTAAAAEDYEKRIRAVPKAVVPTSNDYPRFDLLLLGMGPDGHCCSLFPHHPLVLHPTKKWIAPITDSPKLPPHRITFTLPAVQAAANITFVVDGEDGVAETVAKVFAKELPFGELPSQSARPRNGKLIWFADKAAASKLFPAPHWQC